MRRSGVSARRGAGSGRRAGCRRRGDARTSLGGRHPARTEATLRLAGRAGPLLPRPGPGVRRDGTGVRPNQPSGRSICLDRGRGDLRAPGLGPVERAIELGAGTGQFTRIVASLAGAVEAVDTSPEVLALNAANVPAPNVQRTVADAFQFVPQRPADLVVAAASCWHIPRERAAAFWTAVDGMLRPGGRVFLFDEAPHGLWAEEAAGGAGRGLAHPGGRPTVPGSSRCRSPRTLARCLMGRVDGRRSPATTPSGGRR